jgi:hypothetical protein
MTIDRRRGQESLAALKRQLNDDQRMTLSEIERFGWELKFIRHPPFQPAIPVVFDGERKRFATIEPNGQLNNNPPIKIRP